MTADLYGELNDDEENSVESRNTAGHAFEDQETEDEPAVIGAFQPMLFREALGNRSMSTL